jgi:CRP-like cAMP-binding protein
LEYAGNKMTYPWLDPDQKIYSEFPIKLKYEYCVAIYPELVLECPFFSCYDNSFVATIVPLLKPIEFLKGEVIWKKDDIAGSVIFIVQGEVHFIVDVICEAQGMLDKLAEAQSEFKKFDTLGRTCTPPKTLPKTMLELLDVYNLSKSALDSNAYHASVYKRCGSGSYVGDVDIILRQRRTCHLRAVTRCDAFILSRMDFENVIMGEFPHVYLDLKMLAIKKDSHDQKLLRKKKQFEKTCKNQPKNPSSQIDHTESIRLNLDNFEKEHGIKPRMSDNDLLGAPNEL